MVDRSPLVDELGSKVPTTLYEDNVQEFDHTSIIREVVPDPGLQSLSISDRLKLEELVQKRMLSEREILETNAMIKAKCAACIGYKKIDNASIINMLFATIVIILIFYQEQRLTNIKDKVSDMETKYDTLESEYSDLEEEFNGLQDQFDDLDDQVKEDIATLESLIQAANSTMQDLSAEIDIAEKQSAELGVLLSESLISVQWETKVYSSCCQGNTLIANITNLNGTYLATCDSHVESGSHSGAASVWSSCMFNRNGLSNPWLSVTHYDNDNGHVAMNGPQYRILSFEPDDTLLIYAITQLSSCETFKTYYSLVRLGSTHGNMSSHLYTNVEPQCS